MATCLTNIVNIKNRSCGDTTPTSGLYLDMLAINMEWLNSILQAPYTDAEALFTDKLEFSAAAVSHTINSRFADKFRANSILNGARIGYYNDNLQAVAGEAGYLKGLRVEICNTTSFVDFFLSNISIQSDVTANVSVLVYDLIQAKLLDTIVVPCVAGEISTYVANKTYKSNRKQLNIIFVYDTTAVNSYRTYPQRGGCSDCATSTGGVLINSYIRASGIKIASASSKILSNTSVINDCAGISVNYSLQCNHTDWLCTHANLLAMPILYFLAAELMTFALDTNRENTTTIEDIERIKERKVEYESKYFDAMDNVMKKIKLPNDELCFECNLKSEHKFIAP